MKAIRDLLFLGRHRKEKHFSGHYIGWRAKRLAAILSHYGPSFFFNKKVLEVGCGYGDIGAVFAQLGASVTCSDARRRYLDVVRERHPEINVVQANLDEEWPFEHQDLVVHMGVLYHLSHYIEPLQRVCRGCDFMVLETEVCDSDDPSFVVQTKEKGYDQAISGTGTRPSADAIERVLDSCGMKYERITDARCNFELHRYDWQVTNSGAWQHGLRRFWFVERKHEARVEDLGASVIRLED